MLEDLEILNGIISPEFDIYNNIYSVIILEDVDELVINYKVSDGYVVNIIDNNNLVSGENEVYIQVIKENEINTYTLLVNKEETEDVADLEYLLEPLEVKEELPTYVAPLVGGSCLFLIFIFFLIIFRKRKIK